MRVTKLLALVMIYLVISLIFLSAFVFATIFKAEAYGQDEAPGTIRADDTLTIRTESVRPCTVKADFTNNSYEAMSCGSGTPVVCSYTHSFTNTTGMMSAVVKEDDSGLTENLEVYVDNLAPRINSLSISSAGNKARASYSINDEGNSYYLNKCSGIERVELYLNNQLVNTTNHSVGECNVNSIITGTIPNFIGKVDTGLKVYDYVGLLANKTGSQVFIDSIPPKIASSAKVYKAGTKKGVIKVSTNSSKAIDVDIEIEIDDSAIAPTNSVYGDFSELDKTKSIDQSNKGATCIRQGWNQTYNCTFKNIKLSPSTGSPRVLITATDQVGNKINQNISLSFTVINNAGTVTRLGPAEDKCYEDKCYLSSGANEIIAYMSTSSSFNESDIKIQGVLAECDFNKTLNTWICMAEVSGAKGVLILDGFDDLGNPIKAESELEIILDPTPPKKIGEINVTPICPVGSRGDSLVIKINITERESPMVNIKANTLSISEDNETSAMCAETETSGLWDCVLTIGNLKNKGINTNLNVIVEDYAGNQLIQKVPVSICIEVDEVPDLIEEIKTRGKLPKIDRRVASKITVKVPIGLEIVTKHKDVEITDRSDVDCTDTEGDNGEPHLINMESLKPVLIIPLTYDKKWDEDDKVKINCTQELWIKYGNKVYSMPEEEYISAELEVFNQALGNPDENYERKIDDIKNQIEELDKIIKSKATLHKYLGGFCQIAEALAAVNAVIQTLLSALWGTCIALNVVPGLGEIVWNMFSRFLVGVNDLISSFVWPVGWVPKPPFPTLITTVAGTYLIPTVVPPGNLVGLAFKFGCAIYTCKFYEFNTWLDVGRSFRDQLYLQKRAIDLSTEEGQQQFFENNEILKTTVKDNNQKDVKVDMKGDGKLTFTMSSGTKYVFDYENGEWLTKIGDQPGQIPPYLAKHFENSEVLGKNLFDRAFDTYSEFLDEFNKRFEYTYGTSPKTSDEKEPAEPGKPGEKKTKKPAKEILFEKTDPFGRLQRVEEKYQEQEQEKQDGKKRGGLPGVNLKTGKLKQAGSNFLKLFKNMNPDMTPEGLTADTRMRQAMEAFIGDTTWIYNPYKSKHYDGACAPAILFNSRKERQVLCKRLGCLEYMAEIGGPFEACEFEYGLDMCLYVESAQYHVEEGATFGKFWKHFGEAALNNIFGIGTMIFYNYVLGCSQYEFPGGSVFTAGSTILGIKDVTCGLTGSAFSISEIIDFIKNPYNPLTAGGPKVNLPADSIDFCNGGAIYQ